MVGAAAAGRIFAAFVARGGRESGKIGGFGANRREFVDS